MIPTAKGLAMFRDELGQAGFEPDMVRELVITACRADVATSGLNVEIPDELATADGGALAEYGVSHPNAAGGFVPGPDTDQE